jgi:hypothetical protein
MRNHEASIRAPNPPTPPPALFAAYWSLIPASRAPIKEPHGLFIITGYNLGRSGIFGQLPAP